MNEPQASPEQIYQREAGMLHERLELAAAENTKLAVNLAVARAALTSLVEGLLRPFNPDHPDARLLAAAPGLQSENAKLKALLGAKQAEIDRLMLEYCPDEMTEEQKANWAAHQRPVHPTSSD